MHHVCNCTHCSSNPGCQKNINGKTNDKTTCASQNLLQANSMQSCWVRPELWQPRLLLPCCPAAAALLLLLCLRLLQSLPLAGRHESVLLTGTSDCLHMARHRDHPDGPLLPACGCLAHCLQGSLPDVERDLLKPGQSLRVL